MGKGRKTIPDELKKLRGTDQPCRLTGGVPGYSKVAKIPPSGLKGAEKKIFVTAASELIQCGILETVSVPLLVSYARELALYYRLMKEMEEAEAESNDGLIVQEDTKYGVKYTVNPKRKIAENALANAKAIASEFGFTPANRSKIAALLAGKKQRTDDPFAEFEEIG